MINSIISDTISNIAQAGEEVSDLPSYEKEVLPSWAEAAGYSPCSEEEATHLVIGVGEVVLGKHGGGILAYCDNEFQAHRCAREIRKNPDAVVKVILNSNELRELISLIVLSMLSEVITTSSKTEQVITKGSP